MEKVHEFLTSKQDSLSVHEYGLKFIHLSRYMMSRMSLLVTSLCRASSKEGGVVMLIGDMPYLG